MNDSKVSEKSSDSKSYDHNLWQKVRDYSKADLQKKIEAISTMFNQNRKLPPEWLDLVRELARKEQPREVRIGLANSFAASASLTTGQYFSILELLANDPDKEVSQVVDIELEKYRQQYGFLDSFSNGFNKAIEEMRAKERETTLNILVQHHDTLRQLAGNVHKRKQEMFEQLAGNIREPSRL